MDRDDDRTELFITLLAEHERRLTAYVLTFVPSVTDADDILQDTKIALWRSFEQFESGTNFGAWARAAAFNRILDFRKRKARENQRLVFSDRCLTEIAEGIERKAEQREHRAERLSDCVQKLSADHRRILSLRYFDMLAIDQIAERVERSAQGTYRVLSRIRLMLRDCVSDTGDEPQIAAEVSR